MGLRYYLSLDRRWLGVFGVVLNLFSRIVVGCVMDKHMKATLVCEALQITLWRRKMLKSMLVH
jgi:transposase InsO family protein